MSVINETHRIKLSLAELPSGVATLLAERSSASWYDSDTAKQHIILAKEECNGQAHWRFHSTSLRCNFGYSDMFGFKTGCLYEAEIGQRLVAGKKLSAEAYLRSLESIPLLNLGSSFSPLLVVEVQFDAQHKANLHKTDHYACSLDLQTVMVLDDHKTVKVDIPLTTLNNVRYAQTLHADGLSYRFSIRGSEKLDVFVNPVATPVLGCETAELF